MFRWIFLTVSIIAGCLLFEAGLDSLATKEFEPPPGPLGHTAAVFYFIFGCIFFFGGLVMLVRNLKKSRMG